MENFLRMLAVLFVGLFIVGSTSLQAQIADPIAEQTYQGFQKAFLVKSNNQTYFVDGIAKRDRAFFWGQAFLITSMIDAYEENQSASRKQLVVDLLSTFFSNEKQDWSWDGWVDDVAWACIAMARGYQVTGNQTYLTVAANNWKFNFERAWDNSLGGGIWENMDKYTKASLSNNPMIISGMALYESTGDVYYLNKCKDIYAWFRSSGIYDTTTGVVNEAKVNDGTIQYSDHPYNEGSFINAAAFLYKYTKNMQYFNDAKKAADHIIKTYPIFTEEGDGSARAIARFAHENNLFNTYYPWLANNCTAAWKNRRTDYNITNNNWTTPTIAGEQFAMQCVSAVTAQMVTPVLQLIPNTIEAEDYNYMNGISIENIAAGGKCAKFIKKGDCLEYVIKVPSTGIYTITYSMAGIVANTLLVQQDGETIDSVFFAGTIDMQTYTSVSSPVKLKAGIHSIKLVAASGGFNIDKWSAVSCQSITPSISINGAVAQQTASATVIVGDNITFSPSPIDGTWSWTGPKGYTSNLREITISNIQLDNGGIYSAKHISPDGCTNIQDFMVTLSNCNPTPIVPYMQINGDALQQVSSVTFNAGDYLSIEPQPVDGTWSWTGPNGFSSDSRKISFASILSKQAGEYISTYYNANGCKSTKVFTVALTGTDPCSSPIIPYLSVNGGSWQNINYATLTAGGSVAFGPQPGDNNGWKWTGPNGFASTSREVSITSFNSTKAGYYTATYTNATGCKSTLKFILGLNGCTLASIIPIITVNNIPSVRTDTISLISGDNISIELPISASDGTLVWNGPMGFTSNSSKITFSNILNWQEGKYTATFFNTEGCKGTYSVNIIVNCGTTIIPYIQVNGGSWNQVSLATLKIGGSIKFNPLPNDKNGWNWTGPNGFTSTVRQIGISNITLAQAGIYSAKYTNASGCSSFKDFFVTVEGSTGIDNPYHEETIEIYPNPATDIVTLINIPANTTITLLDLSGRKLLITKSSAGFGDINVNIQKIKAGVYYIKLENEKVETLKLIIK